MKKVFWIFFGVLGWIAVKGHGGDVQWNLYPNPFEDYLAVEWQQNDPGNMRLMLFDVTGKMVVEVEVQGRIGSNVYIVEFEDLPSGPYNFYFHNPRGNKMYHGRIIRE